MTAPLLVRDARVSGVDSSPEMIEAASAIEDIAWDVGDVRAWATPDPLALRAPVDVLVSNATLQWIPEHLDLLPGLLDRVAPGGWFAFQVPGNFDEQSHVIRRELAAEEPYAEHTAGVAAPGAFGPETYLEALAGLGCTVDAWETTYLHVLQGEDPVFTWVSATGARPTLEALPDGLRERFAEEFKARLRAAYPPRPYGTVLAFRRVFVVAEVPA